MENTEQTTVDCTFDCLSVTQVQVFPFKEGVNLGKVKALACVVLNDQFMVRGLRVMDGENGLYVGYPNDPFYKGEDFRSLCFPTRRQLREHIENCVLERYYAAGLDPVEWKVRFRLSDDSIETIVKEADRKSAIDSARAKLVSRYGSELENALVMDVELAEEIK